MIHDFSLDAFAVARIRDALVSARRAMVCSAVWLLSLVLFAITHSWPLAVIAGAAFVAYLGFRSNAKRFRKLAMDALERRS